MFPQVKRRKQLVGQRNPVIFLVCLFLAAGCSGIAPRTTGTKSEVTPAAPSPLPSSTVTSSQSPVLTSSSYTSTPVATVSATRVPTPTETQAATRTLAPSPAKDLAGLKSEVAGETVLYVQSDDMGGYFYVKLDNLPGEPWIGPDQLISSGAFYINLGYANYQDQIAYLDRENALWVSDLAMQNPVAVCTFTTPAKITPARSWTPSQHQLLWTPDDRHLIINFNDQENGALIYHLLTSQIEPCNYQCDRLAISPRTQKLSIWCASRVNPEGEVLQEGQSAQDFAVLEWGGEIWYANSSPMNELLRVNSKDDDEDSRFRGFSLYRNMGWSADGGRVAYFDPQDKAGNLYIVNSLGELQAKYSGKAYELSNYYQESTYLPGLPVQWSEDGQRILLYGIGDPEKPCPDILIDEERYINPACWQVFDVARGQVIWNTADLQNESERPYEIAAISADGTRLAMYSFVPADYQVFIIDVDTKNILLAPPFRASQIRWGPKP